jgi:hypothetical protein
VSSLRGLGNFGDNDNFVLFVGWILAALRARKPFIILIIEGEQGCAKSTHTCLARWCVDPTNPPMRSQPDEERTLAIAALNTHVLAFDNLSRLPAAISDALCRISTGSGFGTRQLYTDQEEIVFDQARPVILNGITELATRPDLRDRSFVLNLPRIAETERRTEDEVWEAVRQLLPEILGALYAAIALALRDYKQVKLKNAPRMADVASWITASEPALGWPSGTFMEAYARNRRATVVYAVEHDVVASAILALAQRNRQWTGTPTLLLEVLGGLITESVRFSQEWPRSPRQLSDRVRRAIPDLREVGVLVHCGRGDTRRISIAATDDLAPPETEDEF